MDEAGLGCWKYYVPRKDFDDFLTQINLRPFSSFILRR